MSVSTAQNKYSSSAASLRPVANVGPVKMADELVRRVLNFLGAAVMLLLLLPVFVVIAICIRIDSEGPVLFIQTRIGKNGVPFPFFKFRSMFTNAEAIRENLLNENEASGPLFKMRQDPRVTKVGRFLRKTSIDELPQLINVLRGEMVLVGPRPALPKEVATYSTYEAQRLSVIPGLTGLWQVSGRSDLTFEDAIDLDLTYIERRSIFFDFVILLRTVPAVLLARGAY